MSDLIENKLPIFDGDRSSFQLWKSKILMYLDTRDLEEYSVGQQSSGSVVKPIDLDSPEHQRKSKKAKNIICLCLTDDILTSVIDLPSAFDVFKHLCDQFEQNGRGARVRAWREFWSIQLNL
jgi:hypothetical protein